MAINIRVNNNSADEIEQLWDQVGAFEAAPSMRALGYRPHFTFAIYDGSAIEQQVAWDAILAAVVGETQLRIEFKRIRWFEGSPLVLWAEPVVDSALARIHRDRSGTLSSSLPAARMDSPLYPRHCHRRRTAQ